MNLILRLINLELEGLFTKVVQNLLRTLLAFTKLIESILIQRYEVKDNT